MTMTVGELKEALDDYGDRVAPDGTITTDGVAFLAQVANGMFSVVETDRAVYIGVIRNMPDLLAVTVESGKAGRRPTVEYVDVLNLYSPGSKADTLTGR